MEKHVTVVGALHIGLGVLGVLAALIVLVATIVPGVLVLSIEREELPLAILATVGCGVALLLIVTFVPAIVGGIGLLKFRSWARYLVLILAVFDLFNVPIGTVVGIYTFWVLIQDETVRLFAPAPGQ